MQLDEVDVMDGSLSWRWVFLRPNEDVKNKCEYISRLMNMDRKLFVCAVTM